MATPHAGFRGIQREYTNARRRQASRLIRGSDSNTLAPITYEVELQLKLIRGALNNLRAAFKRIEKLEKLEKRGANKQDKLAGINIANSQNPK